MDRSDQNRTDDLAPHPESQKRSWRTPTVIVSRDTGRSTAKSTSVVAEHHTAVSGSYDILS
jgi:hypothetical protein